MSAIVNGMTAVSGRFSEDTLKSVLIYKETRTWADQYIPQTEPILLQMAPKILKVVLATTDEDRNHSTDYRFYMDVPTIGWRLRHWKYRKYNDFTIRSNVVSDNKTELDKLKEDPPEYYLYCWADEKEIKHWIFWDMIKFVEDGNLNKSWPEQFNNEGTSFIAIPLDALEPYTIGSVLK